MADGTEAFSSIFWLLCVWTPAQQTGLAVVVVEQEEEAGVQTE